MYQPCACREIQDQLTDYLDDASPPQTHRRIGHHLLDCSDCARHLREIRWTIRQLRSLARETIHPSRRALLLHAFRSRQSA